MTIKELRKLPAIKVRQIADVHGIMGFAKADLIERICDRLGSPEENRVGWRLLDQWR